MSEVHAETVPFVRDTMLPSAAPPARQSGVVLWLRENLFSGPLNILLTLAGLAAVWGIVSHLWPWFAHAVWNASSIGECRQIIAERHGEGTTGACFAIIRERWNQFIFGFYPAEHYWRPTAVFGLMMFAVAPILFSESRRLRWTVLAVSAVTSFAACVALGAPDRVLLAVGAGFVALAALIEYAPRRALAFSVLYPFLAVWMLWGGSIWSPIAVLAGFALALVVWRLGARLGVGLLGLALGVAAAVWWWAALGPRVAADLQGLMPLALVPVESRSFGGFLLALTIGVSGIVMSLPLGIILALARQSNLPVVRTLAVMFIEFIRGVPLITLLFVASILLNYFLPPGTNFDIILRVIIMVTLFAAAYMAEVIRGGLAALPRGQYEGADSLGLTYWQAQRLIILPQALKISIPGIVGTFIGVFKDTTLVTFVGLFDPLKQMADTIRATFAWKGAYWEPYVFTGAIFFILCFAMSRYAMYLERRLKTDHR
ncbi:amino acid ABC transporter permease [Paracoccus chinensis]|uniref:L-glutamine ABC transporter membrane protein /L-glutamate ABC transporter membrane protein /L-aspartate ABC transporter membrane protein /L-asparagine ABC transporter membrane protein n=1 Tax=Paracoccus chinensis TaxID=525640 RepID=A0A1G9CSN0_9RHOB|nr:amino acid ABC transporter permease [Paracoccus chinensis]SDK54666.1 L-glutamine ABC transporter membrane protein /L-glutamate ABC transporter membrane protein /L-aspartate ABC transporter membrane protein /L-asparagine ABC transporter membrane protein [Paracoccus chinensis]